MLTLVIGNKNFSSWSLRPWLVLKQLGEPFAEKHIHLYHPDSKQQLLAASPAGKVPVLLDGLLRVHDSLAICEYLAELFPAARLWPQERADRAEARAISAEMHSGFTALRSEMPMNASLCTLLQPSADCAADIARITTIWRQLRQRFVADGDFLFGHFGIVDAMFAPVVLRFVSYGVTLDPVSQAYADSLLSLPAMQQWLDEAELEQAATDA